MDSKGQNSMESQTVLLTQLCNIPLFGVSYINYIANNGPLCVCLTMKFPCVLRLFAVTSACVLLAEGLENREHEFTWYKVYRNGYKQKVRMTTTLPQAHSRSTRNVYGRDDRIPISFSDAADTYPFSAVVEVSTGCSGVLVANTYVLTSAHCLWNYGSYKAGFLFLSVYIVNRKNKKVRAFVVEAFMPEQWMDRSPNSTVDWEDYDYALLLIETAWGRSNRRGQVQLGMGVDTNNLQQNGVGKVVEMAGFPEDKPSGSVWYVWCPVLATTEARLYFECDVAKGMSGSMVYVKEFECNETRYIRRVVGVFSGTKHSDTHDRRFNTAIRFSPERYLEICVLSGQEKKCKDRYFYYFYRDPPRLQREHCFEAEAAHYYKLYGSSG